MGGLKSRNKGKVGEREVVHLLQPAVDEVYAYVKAQLGLVEIEVPKLQRNQMQSHGGGFDIVGLHWLALEVKYHAVLKLPEWWKQTVEQAGKGQLPVLIYRRNGDKWRVRMMAFLCTPEMGTGIKAPVDVPIENFIVHFKSILYNELRAKMGIRT